MSFTSLLSVFFNRERKLREQKKQEVYSIYCQNCGREITEDGGDVTSTGRIYCHGYKDDGDSRCLDREMMLMLDGKTPKEFFTAEYLSSKEVQKYIKKGKIKEYGALESSASD